MSNILPIGEENGVVEQRDELFHNTHDSGLDSCLVQARMTAPPVRPAEGYRSQDTKKEGELTYV